MRFFVLRAALLGLAVSGASEPTDSAGGARPGYVARRECTVRADSVASAASTPRAADTLCVTRYVSPVLPEPQERWLKLEDVPVLRANGGAGDSAGPPPSARGLGASVIADTGGYELALSGSKSVAVTAGGGGALGVDAALLVNVNGQVADNVWIEGTLSDQNTPVQPEGNTTTLREVDVKYLRVYGRQYEYLLGDYFLRHGRAGEDLFAIQAEGARLRYGENGWAGTVAFARSKGLFRADTLRGVDGKQRGYYLRGRDGRTFITVLAGTERIRRNGVALQRGVDYAIDYSQGRVDFLTGLWVTGENLFTVEFQYVEESFPRVVLAGEAADTVGAFRFSVRGIQEAEDERNPAAGAPDAASLETYRQTGDGVVRDSLGNRVDMPGRRAATVFSGEWAGGERGSAAFSVLGSLLDRNLYSSRDDDDNLGWSTHYVGTHRFGEPLDRGGLARLVVEPEHEHRSRDYAAFGQVVETRGFRDAWNLDASVGERDFDANRLRLSLEPFTGWSLGGGAGYAAGRLRDTTDTATLAPAATSWRTEAFTRWERGASRLALSAEAKRAQDPLRRDNDRQSASAEADWGGWLPRAQATRDDWTTDRATGAIARSELWQPRLSVESPALGERWTWSPEADARYGRSNYEGREAALRDSIIDLGLAQRIRLLGWGPVTGDLYAARRYQRAWQADGSGDRALEAEAATYDQAEANVLASDYLRGYSANMHYRAARTAETPLVESYERVATGRGDYAYDSLLNAYYRVETGGDFVLAGLARDTTLGAQPYQDLQWSLRVDLSPGKWPASFGIGGGFLADVDLSLDIETDHQDSASDPVPLPRFTDRQIDAVRSGRARYEPSARWAHPDGGRSASLVFRREYAKGAGTQAFRERDTETRGEYRHEWSEAWEGAWVGTLQTRWRQGLLEESASRSTDRRAQMLLYRRLPRSITLVPSVEYRRVDGEDAGFPMDLQGVIPRARVEKGAFFGGRASAEYGVFWLFGEGEGSYFVTDGYRKGVTHRFEAVAQSSVQSHVHLNANYLARRDPGSSAWSQRFSAEVRAVF